MQILSDKHKGVHKIIEPFWQTADGEAVRLFHGDVVEVLRGMPPEHVQLVVTSPPYWGLRDYRVDGQIGSEPSPDCGTQGQARCGGCFVCKMVEVFREVRRVLRDDGTLWLNLGDTYSSSGGNTGGPSKGLPASRRNDGMRNKMGGLPSGNLVGVPWRVALALQADGWVLRQDVIWHKPSPMPESVRNRCTKAHEYVFLLTKRADYFIDMEAIKEKARTEKEGDLVPYNGRQNRDARSLGTSTSGNESPDAAPFEASGLSNKRSVWRVSSQGYAGAHFATFPPKLIEPMILAGTSAKGACVRCGAPWERVTSRIGGVVKERTTKVESDVGRNGKDGSTLDGEVGVAETVGWAPTCRCTDQSYEPLPVRPCTVLDPFVGSGTTAEVCISLGNRRCWGIDLSDKYLRENAIPRIEGALKSVVRGKLLVPEKTEVQMSEADKVKPIPLNYGRIP